jgi:hypothetical protein
MRYHIAGARLLNACEDYSDRRMGSKSAGFWAEARMLTGKGAQHAGIAMKIAPLIEATHVSCRLVAR